MDFEKPQRFVDRVFLHCSASDKPEHDSVKVMRDWHVNGNGWDDVGYHFFIRKDGKIEAGRDLEKTPAAQRGHNRATIAICLHGLAVEKFRKAQFKSVIELCKAIEAAYQGMVSFHGHCEVSSKSCPVFPYKKVLGLDEHGSMDFAATESPNAAPPEDPGRPVLRLMDRGAAVLELQNLLSATGADLEEDGIFGQVTLTAVKKFQKKKKLAVDGIVGPKTWTALLA
jgi:N-acetyl-anhydromuramyl-L-alanine amidase AmpD